MLISNWSHTPNVFLLFLLINFISCQPNKQPILTKEKQTNSYALNVFGNSLQPCSFDPLTGFYRNGKCLTGFEDFGTHILCAKVTDAFLNYSKSQGNDLKTPIDRTNFQGLKDGDRWCLCISRWVEAIESNVAPPIDLNATHENVLKHVDISLLMKYGIE